MEIVSEYVREQKCYTKNALRDIFCFDEDGIEKFIKNLKSYGVLKSVKSRTVQLEMSDLLDDDVEITEEAVGSGDCLYVFTYVGIITCGSRIVKVYPKYLLSKKDDVLKEMQQVLKVLEKYNRSEEQIIHALHGNGENRSFNILAVILFLLRDYYEYGIYSNTENSIEVNGQGEILWEKTMNESSVLLEVNCPYYMELYTKKTVEDDGDYFKRLHEYVLTECYRQLHDAQLDILFDMDSLILSDASLEDFGERDYILERIWKELNLQFHTRRQVLLKTLYAYISQNRRMLEENSGISMYGTTAYYTVWEKVCAEVFDNKLQTTLEKLNMTVPLAERYQIKTERHKKLIDIIEKPIWQGIDTKMQAADTLRPDFISISCIDGKDYFFIFDAKYYNLQLEQGKSLKGNPSVGDVTKQYLYQLAYKEFIKLHHITEVRNCFLLPTEEDEVVSKGVAKLPMLEALGLENIQIRLIPAAKLYECYLTDSHMDIRLLQLM